MGIGAPRCANVKIAPHEGCSWSTTSIQADSWHPWWCVQAEIYNNVLTQDQTTDGERAVGEDLVSDVECAKPDVGLNSRRSCARSIVSQYALRSSALGPHCSSLTPSNDHSFKVLGTGLFGTFIPVAA